MSTPEERVRYDRLLIHGDGFRNLAAEDMSQLTGLLDMLSVEYELFEAASDDVRITREDFNLSTESPGTISTTWNTLTVHGRFLEILGQIRSGEPLPDEDRAAYERLAEWQQAIYYDEHALSRNGLMAALQQGHLGNMSRPLGPKGHHVVEEVVAATRPGAESE